MDQPVNPFRNHPNGQDDNTLPTVDLVGDVTLPPLAPNGATPHPLQQTPQAWTPPAPPVDPLPMPTPTVPATDKLVLRGKVNYFQKNDEPDTPVVYDDSPILINGYTAQNFTSGLGETNPLPKGPKSKVLALVLLFFLGIFGAHNFYLKHYKVAVFQLLCGLFLFHSEVAGLLDTVRAIFVLWLVANFINILRGAGRYSENF